MTEQEIIRAWKENMVGNKWIPDEMKKFARKIGFGQFHRARERDEGVQWEAVIQGSIMWGDEIWRLPDYQPEPEVVKCQARDLRPGDVFMYDKIDHEIIWRKVANDGIRVLWADGNTDYFAFPEFLVPEYAENCPHEENWIYPTHIVYRKVQ